MISQVFIMILGASAIWFVSRKEDWKRWGYIFGMLSQPFWFYTAYINEQWGILVMCLFYTYSWGQGIWNYWIVRETIKVSELKMKNPPPPPFTSAYSHKLTLENAKKADLVMEKLKQNLNRPEFPKDR